jgi:hypothetical protein
LVEGAGAMNGNEGTGVQQVGEYSVPTDPMDQLQCDSCQ